MIEVTVERIGARGDGVAELDGRPVFVPLTAPGDRVRARPIGRRGDGIFARLDSVLAPGAGRATPPCPHYGACGGCALQHIAVTGYRRWKSRRVTEALARRGISGIEPRPVRTTPPGSRRRATVAALRRGRRVILGYHARASHDLVAIEVCPVLVPPIVALLAPLGTASLRILERGERATFVITETETGIDLVVDMDRSPSLAAREVLAAFAEDHDLARVSWRRRDITEPIAWRRPALLNFAGVAVDLPPGAFIQASAVGEAAIRDAVIDEIEIADRIADLYAGCGTLSFPLAQVAQVWAVEGDAAMVAAINAAARAAGFSHRIVAECRDLARRPLVPEELDRFAAVVFDPPRAGARKQAEALAESAVPRVVAVSCDPGTFARDGRILLDGGYRLESVTPIDQFLWSAAVELVAVFRRSGPR